MPNFTFAKPYYNVATEANRLASEEAYNVYFEAMPGGGYAVRRRPGLTLVGASTEDIGKGLYWSDKTVKLYLVRGNTVYTLNSIGSAPILLGYLNGSGKTATFAEGQKLDLTDIIYVANGGELSYIDTLTNAITVPSGSPPSSSFVAMMGNRFIANDVFHNQDFRYTDVNLGGDFDPTYWGGAYLERTSQKPDPLRGVYTGWNEIFLWGTQSCEVWQDDGVTPLSPLVGSVIEAGVAAPYSVCVANNTLIALATVQGKRAVITVQGRNPQIISEPIANILQSYEKVADATGMLCFVGGLNVYVLNFPTEDVTWTYDFKTDTWSQWSYWDLEKARHRAFLGNYGVYAKAWNQHLTLSNSGELYELSRNVYTDNGNPMKSSIRTGWIDHGTWDRKRSDQLIVKLKGYINTDAKVLMRWRSDGFQEWSTAIEINISANQQNDHFCKLNRMGMYRSRQYEFILTDAADLALIGFEEDVTRLRN